MTFISYAQNFEDVILWRALQDVKDGHYIDIGAQDPVVDSVSLAFYEAGWRGIHVEPTPFYAAKLREARPDEVVIEAAVTDASGPIPFFEIPGTGISTGRPHIADHHAKLGFEPRQILTPTVRLDELLEGIEGDLHWVKVDVEGMEADVLRSWGKCGRRPWVLVVESTFPNTQKQTSEPWIGEVLQRGYKKIFFDGLSCYFIHQDHRKRGSRLNIPANIFDAFAVAPHHFSASQIRTQLDATKQRLDVEWARAEKLQTELVQVQHARDLARDEHKHTLERLLVAETAHRATVESLSAERQAVELELRREFRESEDRLRQVAADAEEKTAAARVGLARVEERCEQFRQSESRLRQGMADAEGKAAAARVELARLDERCAQLQHNVDSVQIRLSRADALIRAVLAERPNRWQRIGQAFGLARRGLAWRELERWSPYGADPRQTAAVEQVTSKETESGMHTNPPSHERESPPHATSLAELLSFDDEDFVRLAYLTVLGRSADPEGEAYYADRLKCGRTKIEVLDQLRKSGEAKLVPPLPGLGAALWRFRVVRFGIGKRAAGASIEREIVRDAAVVRVDDFMRYHDEDFLIQAFAYYLGRKPDQGGFAHYLRQIRNGVSRQQVLLDIARSPEAKARGRTAVGESAVAAALLINRIPFVGGLLTVLRFNLNLRKYLREMRALENHLYRLSKNLH